ncbi:hypothetical protein AVEN_27031-1 [Araneus ventricosus]|uniref:Uncharacterized protein n=1 Tax=Araneus ventricosus TaxID=182803 RepID=A0A4Y2QU06_ARAVE|nr:hypothetical protein AVEN_27031-1 [Araneus ventricosus]
MFLVVVFYAEKFQRIAPITNGYNLIVNGDRNKRCDHDTGKKAEDLSGYAIIAEFDLSWSKGRHPFGSPFHHHVKQRTPSVHSLLYGKVALRLSLRDIILK